MHIQRLKNDRHLSESPINMLCSLITTYIRCAALKRGNTSFQLNMCLGPIKISTRAMYLCPSYLIQINQSNWTWGYVCEQASQGQVIACSLGQFQSSTLNTKCVFWCGNASVSSASKLSSSFSPRKSSLPPLPSILLGLVAGTPHFLFATFCSAFCFHWLLWEFTTFPYRQIQCFILYWQRLDLLVIGFLTYLFPQILFPSLHHGPTFC